MGIGKRARRAISWGAVLLASSLAGGLWFAFTYVTDSGTLVEMVQSQAPRYLPGTRLELGKVRVRPFIGEVELTRISLHQTLDGHPFLAATVPWMKIRHDARAMLRSRRFVPSEVVVAQPTVRLRRRADGTWNLQGILADPWPGPPMGPPPPVTIQNGTVELYDGDARAATAILREVSIRVEAAGGETLRFEGTAKGDLFDRLALAGTIDRATRRVALKGDLARLVISETLRKRLPPDWRPEADQLGLTSGEVDIRVDALAFDPEAKPRVRFEGAAQLRSGVCNCKKLPFPLSDISASVAVKDGVLAIDRAEGYNGPTTVRVERGRIGVDDPARGPMELHVDVLGLELDDRLRRWTPPEFAGLWDEFSPSGRASVALDVARGPDGKPAVVRSRVDCRDVAMVYRYFKYPLDHVRGRIEWEGAKVRIELQTLVGNKPMVAKGTIEDPGPSAHVVLDFKAEALPIDRTLLDAMPPDVRAVVDQFQPTGTVSGAAHLDRVPPKGPDEPPQGTVAIDAVLDLNERCAIKWAGMPYPVNNLTGRLEVHPNLWTIKDMSGSNGQAVVTGNGEVRKLPGPAGALAVDLHLNAERLPFDDQLRAALPADWQAAWKALNPFGSTDVDARIKVAPGQPDDYKVLIDPRDETSVRLSFSREAKKGVDPGGTFDLRMDDVKGRFFYDNGAVDMRDVGFGFYGAPVQFAHGTLRLGDLGRFKLGVTDLWARNVRLDSELRKIMPPVMAQFALRLDDGKPYSALKGNLGLGWDGPGRPVWCAWDNTLVVFNGNTIQAGIPLDNLQGQLDHVRGQFVGDTFAVDGILKLDSIGLRGQQVTGLETPFHVGEGTARLTSIRGKLLGGELDGRFEVSLDATPRYAASLSVQGADLQQYAKTLPGRQDFRGTVNAKLDLNGLGNDLHTLQGKGEAHIVQGDLGELPPVVRMVNVLKLSQKPRTAFDSADLAIALVNGDAMLDPIRLTGNAFSLEGGGKLHVQGDLDLRLQIRLGRDRFKVPLVTNAVYGLGSQFFTIRVQGTPAYPQFKLEPFPFTRRDPLSDQRRQ